MNLNPIANGNKTAAGTMITGGSIYTMVALYMLRKYGVDEQTALIIISALPGGVLTLWGILHKISKAGGGGIIGIWRWALRYVIGIQDLKKVERKVETTSVENR